MPTDPTDPRHGKCPGTNRKGQPCRKTAGYGTNHLGVGLCVFHTGATPNGVKHAQRLAAERALAALDANATYGRPRPVDPAEALLEEVARTAAHVEWLAARIRDLDPNALVQGVREIRETAKPGQPAERVSVVASVPSVWLNLYHRERRHLVEVCRVTLAAGVQERYVRLAEEQGAVIVRVLEASLAELGLAGRADVGAVVARHLRAVDG